VTRAAVLGTGTWGTAFAMILAEAGTDTVICGRRVDITESINERHENPWYQPGIELPPALRATTDVEAAVADADFVVLAVPAQTLRENLLQWAPALPDHALLVSLMKGIELGSSKRMSEVIREVADVAAERVAVVSGPNLALEIAQRQPAASVIACVDHDAATRLQNACQTAYFRPYTNRDVVGCELAGAVKNVIALAVGIAAGMGYGDNSKATLITRGLSETAKLGSALGADPMTFAGLAGLGDLVATCSSPLSRNRSVGEHLGRGMGVEASLAATRTTAEGVLSSKSILELARKHDVEVPIIDVVVSVLFDGLQPIDGVTRLMARTTRPERHDS
jgi:glycerol-3-phosphate dehydrogenase (NAD(P)+)